MRYTPKSRYNRLTQKHNDSSVFSFFNDLYYKYKKEAEDKRNYEEHKRNYEIFEEKEKELDDVINDLNNNEIKYTFILNSANIEKRINEKTKILIALTYNEKDKRRKKLEQIENKGLIFLN